MTKNTSKLAQTCEIASVHLYRTDLEFFITETAVEQTNKQSKFQRLAKFLPIAYFRQIGRTMKLSSQFSSICYNIQIEMFE